MMKSAKNFTKNSVLFNIHWVVRSLLVVFLLFGSVLHAEEKYTEEQIKKHLETIFEIDKKGDKEISRLSAKEISYHMDFSDKIKNQEELKKIVTEVMDKYSKITGAKFLKRDKKLQLTFNIREGKPRMKFNSLDDFGESYIYFDFVFEDEIFEKMERGFWYNRMFYKYRNRMDTFKGITKKKKFFVDMFSYWPHQQFHLIVLNSHRSIKNNFKLYLERLLYYRFLYSSTNTISKHIHPSVFDKKSDLEFNNKVSEFDELVLREYYRFKDKYNEKTYKEAVSIILESFEKQGLYK